MFRNTPFAATGATLLGAAALLLPAKAGHAQNTVVFGGSGSSALFNSLARAARTAGYNNTYTLGSGNASAGFVSDPTSAVREAGNLFVAWQGPSGSRRIIYYLSVDSTVGVRAYQNNAGLGDLDGGGAFPAPPVSGNNINIANFNQSPFPNDQALPADVYTTITSQPFNGGGTDITPSDALATTQRAFDLGYNAANTIKSSYSSSEVTPVAFNLSSRPSVLFNIGASPVVVFVNRADTTAGGLGSAGATNINRFTLAGFYNGTFRRTSDIIAEGGLPEKFVTVNMRETLSGTYVTFEFCVPASLPLGSSQESGVGSGAATNPLNETDDVPGQPGGRRRVVGTGQMVAATNAVPTTGADTNPNRLGYAFWSTGTFSAANAGNTKYLTVDGVDPLLPAYTGGTYPSSGINFDNVRNGSYPIWTTLRLLLPQGPAGDLADFTNAISADDVVPANQLRVFRSFRPGPGALSPSNGNVPGTTPAGANAGGAVFLVNNDLSFFNDTGSELVGFRQ